MKKIVLVLALVLLCTVAFASEGNVINGLDKLAVKPYNEKLDTAGTVFQFASLGTAAILLREPTTEYKNIAVMYGETVLLTYAVKEIAKTVIKRDRPYTYYPETAPVSKQKEWNKSMPSGHTALAFAGCAFTSYVFCKYHSEAKVRIPVITTCSALAVTTAVLRVQSGSHFITDVLAGAAIGTAIGIAVPYVHTLLQKNSIDMSVSPFGLYFSKSF